MSTLEQIAKELGISTASVSRALNNKPGVSEETRRQVMDLATSLNYAPSIAARSLATSSTNMIGFLSVDRPLPLSADPFYLHILRGAEEEFSRNGYFVIISTVNVTTLQSPMDLQLIREKRVDGVILPGPFFPEKFVRAVKTSGIPMVLVDNLLPGTPVNSIMNEDEGAGYEATRHLIGHGRRKIVAISGPCHWPSNRLRASGYQRAMLEAGLTPYLNCQSDSTSEAGFKATIEVIKENPDVDGIFAINDAMAMGVLQAAKEIGCAVPKDLPVIGVDDVEMVAHTNPPLTTMRIQKRYMGIIAARRLIHVLKYPDEPPVISMVPTELVIRSSCGCS